MNEVPTARTRARLLEVRTVEVISGQGVSVTLSSVRCPVRAELCAVEVCADCGPGRGIAQDALARGPRRGWPRRWTRVALAVTEETEIRRARSLMAGQRVDRLAVAGADGVVVGVLAASDVIAWLAEDRGTLA